jgi:hypothetical protein
LYQVSSKSPKGFRGNYEEKVFLRENAKFRDHNSFKNNWTDRSKHLVLPLTRMTLHDWLKYST